MNHRVPSKLEILDTLMRFQSRAASLMFESESQKSSGRLKEAAESYHQLIEVLHQQLEVAELNNRQYPDSPFDLPPIVELLLNAELTLADVLEGLEKYPEAEAFRDDAVTLCERYLPGSGTAERYRQRAQSLLVQSRYPEALVALHKALEEFKELGDFLHIASVMSNIAEVLEWLGDYSRALSEAETAARLIEPVLNGEEPSEGGIAEAFLKGKWKVAEQKSKLLQIWLDLEQIVARTNRRLGNFDEAEAHFKKVLPKVPVDFRPALACQFAFILVERGEYERGLKELQLLEPRFVGLMRPKLGVLWSWKSEALLGLNRPEEALQQAESSVQELIKYRDADSLWKAQWRTARALSDVGRKSEALATYLEAAQTVDNLRKAPLGYRLDSTYMADKLPLFDQAIRMACNLNQAEAASKLIELVKSRALTATLTLPRIAAPDEEGELERQVDALSRQIDAIEYSAYRKGSSQELEQRRKKLLHRRFMLLERIRFSDPRWRALSAPPTFEVHRLLDVLKERDQAALTLFFGQKEIVAGFIKNYSFGVDCVSITQETREALDAYRVNLQASRFRPVEFDPAGVSGLSADKLVPGNFLEEALLSKSLVVVPHGPLHLLPWAALEFDGKRLFERCPIGILPNLTCLVTLHRQLSLSPRIALIGAPAYGKAGSLEKLLLAEAEIQTIEDIYRQYDAIIHDPLIGKDATEEGFWKLSRMEKAKGAIVHIACHGKFETGEPLNSGLLLTDGRLDSAEIAHNRLPFSEVVLSACSSGYRPTEAQGVPLSGDDVLGLPGAFLEAGADSVLVSITKAREDATLQLLTLYHEQRSKGVFPLFALQKAQQKMMENQAYPPYLWVGFTLYGCR
jgi:tetratricopeptide (TPR) repeat protein